MSGDWHQSRFNATLKELLERSDSTTWPRAINKHGFFVALKALELTERTSPDKIEFELDREITAKRHDRFGQEIPSPFPVIPIGLAIAAKRASKSWVGSKQFQRAQRIRLAGKAFSYTEVRAWRALVGQKLRAMIGGRRAS